MCKGRAEHRPETAQVSANHPICHIQTRGGLDDLAPPVSGYDKLAGKALDGPAGTREGYGGCSKYISIPHDGLGGTAQSAPDRLDGDSVFVVSQTRGGPHPETRFVKRASGRSLVVRNYFNQYT